MKKYIIITICFFIFPLIAFANSQYLSTGIVRSIVDGDTIWIIDSQKKEQKIRLYGIDCPEIDQAYGIEAAEFLKSLIDGQSVKLIITGHDRYDRVVAIVMKDSQDIGLKLIGNILMMKNWPNMLKLKILRETKRLGCGNLGMRLSLGNFER
jgi:endonuclease YncB( thermonuclease family)